MPTKILTTLYNIGANVAYWVKNPELDFLDDVLPDDISVPSPTKDLSTGQQVQLSEKLATLEATAIEDAQKFTKPASQIDSDDAESSDCLFTPQRQVAKRDAQRSVTSSDLPPAKRPRVPGLSHEGDDEQTAHKKLQPS